MLWSYGLLLAEGAATTLLAALCGGLLGLAGGIGLLAARTSGTRLLVLPARVYISFMRGTPALVQILLIFYGLPGLIGVDLPPLMAGIIAIGANSAAFSAEILRGSLSRVGKGQYEAAHALGLPFWTVWVKIVVPQILMRAIPPLASEFTMVVKATSLLSVVTIVELTRRGQQIMFETFRPIEVLLVVAAIYFVICFFFTSISRVFERRAAAILREGGGGR